VSRKSKVKNGIVKTVPAPGSFKGEKKVAEQTKVEEKKEQNCCGRCRWYDVSTERDFRRDGIRKGLVEIRAICKASKEHSKASNHLVKKESVRPCFEAGVYVAPVKETKEKKKEIKVPKTEQKERVEKIQKAKGKKTSV
jgi:hypothetical protein